jgi:lysophospholipase L1-like esterase
MIGVLARPHSLPPAAWRRFRRLAAVALAAACASCGGDEAPTAPSPPAVQPLTLQCPAAVQGQSANGAPVSIQLPAPTTSGGVLPVTVSCAPTGTPFPVGSTRVSCTASDARGSSSSCAFDVLVAPPPLARTSFLAFGDSMTAGEITVPAAGTLDAQGFPRFTLAIVPSASYPTELLTRLRGRYVTQSAQFVVTNAGVSREWAGDGPKRFASVFASSGAQVVLLMEGANDLSALGARGVSTALIGLQTMMRQARAGGATVFIASIPPPRPGGVNTLPLALVHTLNESIRAGAPAEGAIFVDVYAAMAPDVPVLIGIDGLHPTEAGYQRIAETFFAAIRATFEGR